MIFLGLLPKAAIVAAIRSLSSAGLPGDVRQRVAVVGIQALAVDLRDNRNAVIVSTSIGLAVTSS